MQEDEYSYPILMKILYHISCLNVALPAVLCRIEHTLLRMERKMKRPRSTSSKKPTHPSSVKQLKGRTQATRDTAHPKNVMKQTAKARPAKGR